ncbi:MAG: XkdX family protein [Clostridia bacterium]|nr:XkdX family protein [Clostridia bacterium]
MAEKSKNYLKVKKYYDDGRWSLKKVRDAVRAGWITPEEFTEITGEEYEV